jgi:hypothetical protein
MRKAAAILLAACLALSACACAREKAQYPGSSDVSVQSSSGDAQSSSASSESPQASSSPASSSSNSADKDNVLNEFACRWRARDNKYNDSSHGGTFLELKVSGEDGFTGTYCTVADNLSHIATVDLVFTPAGGAWQSVFTDDGWGNSGKVDFVIDKERTLTAYVKITSSSGTGSLYGLRTGTIHFVKE